MSISELWSSSRSQLEDKHVQQIIAFAGAGQLTDRSPASDEFRQFLDHVPSRTLARYAAECLETSFSGSGLALQDIVNQVGKRLGFSVEDGLYRGTPTRSGFDGLWVFPDKHGVVVEVKTTDTYRIDLNRIAEYRHSLVSEGKIAEQGSSVLIVVGRQDTGDLEAQIRGSRFGWDMRLVSVDALLDLMFLKERVDDPALIQRICSILKPQEFTRLDDIIKIVFSAAKDAQEDGETEDIEEAGDETKDAKDRAPPMAFHEACVARVERQLRRTLVRRTRTLYSSPDDRLTVICAVSKAHRHQGQVAYWFAFHPHQKETLEKAAEGAYLVLGCGSQETVLLIPFAELSKWLDDLWTTERDSGSYWHIRLGVDENQILLNRKKGKGRLDITAYRVA
jgi:hypothetical protein